MKDDVMVSILCLAYNHEKYIRRALEGFLSQETDFQYEILIHDDASTDKNADIIREYARRFPEIIKPWYQITNQHSKKVPISIKFQYPRVKGKYVALCEGDDFWTDSSKLQKQVEYMETHENCSLCFHNANIVDVDETIIRDFFPSMWPVSNYFYKPSGNYTAGEIALLGFIPTASMLFPISMLDYNNLPEFFNNGVCGDLPLMLTMAARGYAHYIDEIMSAYRTNNPNSMAGQAWHNKKLYNTTLNTHICILKQFDIYTNFRFHQDILKDIKRREFLIGIYSQNINILFTKKYKEELGTISCCKKLKISMRLLFPRFYGYLYKLKKTVLKIMWLK